MVNETESEIESIDIANDDLIDVLAALVEYRASNAAHGTNERLAIIGDGPQKMAMPTSTTNVVEDEVIYASELITDGEIVDEIEIDGQTVNVHIL